MLSVTFYGAVIMKVMDQKTLVERRWSHKVRRTVYILTLSEFARHEFTNLDWKPSAEPYQILFFSL